MAKQIIVTKDNYGIEIVASLVNQNKESVDVTGQTIEVVIVDDNDTIVDKVEAQHIDSSRGIVSITLQKKHTSTTGLYKTYWSALDENNNVTAQDDIYYYCKDKNGGVDDNFSTENEGFDNESIIEKFKETDAEIDDIKQELDILHNANVSTEVIDARGGYYTLGERLDVVDNDLTGVHLEMESINASLDNITDRIVNLENNGTGGSGLDLDNVIEGEIFTSVIQTYPCESLTLSESTLSFNNLNSQTITTTVTPTNCTDKLTWSVSPSGIVNISNGVVTPIKNGNCVITATCGDKTKTCSVNVNVNYSITNNLTNVTSNNSTTSYALGSSYSATLSANEGYILSTVTVTMGGSDITTSVNNNGVINISNITGNIVITANAVEKTDITYSITNNLTNVINSNSVTTVNENTPYSATLSANAGYNLSTVTVTMGGLDITSSVYSEGNIYISSVTGNVIINATADVVVIASKIKATTEIIDGKTYLVVDDISNIKSSSTTVSAFAPNSYKNENYRLYSTNAISFKDIWDKGTEKPFGDIIPFVSVSNSQSLLTHTTTGDLCANISSAIQLRLPLDLNGYSTVEEYLENKYEKLKFALIDTVKTKVIEPSKITNMTLKTSNNGFQYAQFNYSDLPTSNIYNGANSLFVFTGANANLSNSPFPTACMSTSTLSICFENGTFEEFTLDNVKKYLTENPLVFWYK